MPMNLAENVEEIYHNFEPENYINEEDNNVYVPIYKKDLRELSVTLTHSLNNSESIFIAGQSGNGKTSAINYLLSTDEKIQDKYHVKYIMGREIFRYEDIDIIDLLLMMGLNIVQGNESLSEKYLADLTQLVEVKDGSLELQTQESITNKEGYKAKAELGFGVKFLSIVKSSLTFEADYSASQEVRDDARKVFSIKKMALIETINNIIIEWKKQNSDGKELLVVIDDLEKTKRVDIKENLFMKEIPNLFNSIKCVKIVSIPVYIKRYSYYQNIRTNLIYEFGIKIKKFREEGYIKENIDLLCDVVRKRITKEELFDSSLIQKMVELSGGNIRELIKLVNAAAFEAMVDESESINEKGFLAAKEKIQLLYSPSVAKSLSHLLKIQEKKLIEDKEEDFQALVELTTSNLVFAYFNGSTWYDVHPLIEETMEFYKVKGIT